MIQDPIVEEVHRIREAIAARFNNDLQAICDDARQRQLASGRPAVAYPPRPAEEEPPSTHPLPDRKAG
jgi:hypothetical protein